MSMLSLRSHVPDDVIAAADSLPGQADVVVIGGGIIGAAAAFHLAGAGLSTVLLEADKVSSQQSGRNWGFVRTQYRDPLELPLAVEALALWPELERELDAPIGWRRTGCVFVAATQKEMAAFAGWHESTRNIACDARLLSARETVDLLPSLRGKTEGALYTASDGQAEPALATLAFAQAAARLGVRIIEDCGALAIEIAGGVVNGVETEHGRIRCNTVVCAAGAQSHRLLMPLGLTLPQQSVRSTVSLTAPLPPLSEACFCGFGIGLRQRADGSCIIAADSTSDIDLSLDSLRAARFFLPGLLRHGSGFSLRLGRAFIDDLHERLAVPDRERTVARRPRIPTNSKLAARTGATVRNLFAGATGIEIVKSWAGRIDVLPDALPVLDAPSGIGGLIVATGFSGHGFGLAPAVGRHVARLAKGEAPAAILEPLRLDRFARGTYSAPHAPL
ncbi:Glycine/D-amino acid oxidase [Bosea sp. CRIB-10]|uniref:NAD(P)/FAD-dependent oxidoreductase n=1 Tax=Bosea sp. CRIB-10 TaxID=378404 RepID=UPI0008E26584|nr:FAD-binding oxidoreductase [Bosea sp. CRIB-10]SFB78846.1 Glycine/D-amino acid oxidase [Bosea sp. CRIB-10]